MGVFWGRSYLIYLIREGVKVEKKSAIIIALFYGGGGEGSEVTIALLILILK